MADLSQRGRLMVSKTERMGGRKRDSNATRASLLGAARDLFARHGYDTPRRAHTPQNSGGETANEEVDHPTTTPHRLKIKFRVVP
jgi:hypothetical protein